MTTHPICPVCGAYMKQLRRGATLARRGPIYLCPVDDSETTIDECGNLRRSPDATHVPARRTWTIEELS